MKLFYRAAHLRSMTYWTPRDFVACIEGAMFCPYNGVVLSRSGDIVQESFNIGIAGLDLTRARDKKVVPLSGTYALLRSRVHNYYHTIVDNLPRVLTLERPPFDQLSEILLLCPGGATDLESFFLDRFGLSNVRPIALEQGFVYELERLIFTPFKSGIFSGYLPDWYVGRLREKLFPMRPSRRNRRIFISREHAVRQERKIVNEDEIRSLLCELGFEVRCPELLSFEEQIEMFYDAEAVVGVHGAGLTNTLYAPPGLKVVEIFASNEINPAYYFLCKSLDHRYSWVAGDGEGLFPPQFGVNTSRLLMALNQLGVVGREHRHVNRTLVRSG